MSAVALVSSAADLPFDVGAVTWDPAGLWVIAGASRRTGAVSPVGGIARIDAATGLVRWQLADEWRVTALAVRPDGRRVAVASQKSPEFVFATGQVRVLDSATGEPISNGEGLGDVLYSSDGRYLVFREDFEFDTTHRILLVDGDTGEIVRNDLGTAGGTTAFSSDSRLLAIADASRVVVWDVTTGAQLGTVATTRSRLAFRADDGQLVAYGGRHVTVFNPRTGAVGTDVGLDLPVSSPFLLLGQPIQISPNRRVIAAHLGSGAAACGVDDGHRVFFTPFPRPDFRSDSALIFSPNSHHIVINRIIGSNPAAGAEPGKGVTVLDGDTGSVVWQDAGDDVLAIAYNRDGTQLAAAGRKTNGGGFVRIYDARRLELSRRMCRGRVLHVCAASNGARRVAAADAASTATVFDADTGQLLTERSHTGILSSIGFSADGRHLATGGTAQLVHLFAVEGGAKLWAAKHAGTINALMIGPKTGQWIVTACADRTARLYHRDLVDGENVDDHQFRWKNVHPQSVTDIAINADERWIATTCTDHTTRILDAASGTEKHRYPHPNGQATAIEFSRTGTLLAIAVTDGTALVVDAVTGDIRRQVTHPADVIAAAISADGSLLATADRELTVRVWSLAETTAKPVHTFACESPIAALAFNPTDRSLAIATEAGVVAIFDVDPDTGEEQYRFTHPASVRHIAYSSDGSVLASACDDQTARAYTNLPL